MVDPAGRYADLCRFVIAECNGITNDIINAPQHEQASNTDVTNLIEIGALDLKIDAARRLLAYEGYTEMPDAKRERLG